MTVFGGCDRLSAALKGRGWKVLAWDSRRGAAWDLAQSEPARLLRAWIRSGVVWGLCLQPPFGKGQVQIPDAEQRQDSRQDAAGRVIAALVRTSVSIVHECHTHRVPILTMCEAASNFWRQPSVIALESRPFSSVCRLDSCRYGECWSIARRLLGHRVSVCDLGRVCGEPQ